MRQARAPHLPLSPVLAADLRAAAIANGEPPEVTRLTVLMAPRTEAAINRFIATECTTQREAVRRLIALGGLVDQAVNVDGADLLVRRNGTMERIIIV